MRISDWSSDVCSSDLLFRRYRAGEWPIGEAGEAHFNAMADPGLGLPHARIASGDSFVACPDAAAALAARGATLVDMEVGAVGQGGARLCQPWRAIQTVYAHATCARPGECPANAVRPADPPATGHDSPH